MIPSSIASSLSDCKATSTCIVCYQNLSVLLYSQKTYSLIEYKYLISRDKEIVLDFLRESGGVYNINLTINHSYIDTTTTYTFLLSWIEKFVLLVSTIYTAIKLCNYQWWFLDYFGNKKLRRTLYHFYINVYDIAQCSDVW